jgi:hypothetical protein
MNYHPRTIRSIGWHPVTINLLLGDRTIVIISKRNEIKKDFLWRYNLVTYSYNFFLWEDKKASVSLPLSARLSICVIEAFLKSKTGYEKGNLEGRLRRVSFLVLSSPLLTPFLFLGSTYSIPEFPREIISRIWRHLFLALFIRPTLPPEHSGTPSLAGLY